MIAHGGVAVIVKATAKIPAKFGGERGSPQDRFSSAFRSSLTPSNSLRFYQLASERFFVRFHPSSGLFGFFQSNGTRNGTRCDRRAEFLSKIQSI
jgi:hypothetical protein